MNVEDFRHQARANLEETLNCLQTATLLVAELDTQIAAAGRSIQSLSQMIEDFTEPQAGSQSASTQASPPGSDSPDPGASL